MSRAYLTRVAGNYGDIYTFNLQEDDGTPSDLTGSTILFKVRREGYSTTFLSKPAAISGAPTGGVVTYTVASGDFNSPGLYYCQIQATYAAKVLTWDVLVLMVQLAIT